MDILGYYSRKDVQKVLVDIAKNREVSVMYGLDSFGKRPDILQYESDVIELAKKGATSFHISEEHWANPLLLKSGMTKSELDRLRVGWDFVIDIDSKDLKHSKTASYFIVEALKFHDIKNISVKFSGNKGFHIGIPFSAFPSTVNNVDIKLLFPEGVRVIATYLQEMIKDHLDEKKIKGLVDIDTVLISNRHMFRAPYSYHEKSGLISLPISPDEILDFDKSRAKPENIKVERKFLDKVKMGEASQLIMQAFDFISKKEKGIIRDNIISKIPSKGVKEEFFPPCITLGLRGLSDGRKRFLFILNNFLRNIGYKDEEIEKFVLNWNKKNKEKLRENYIQTQLSWHKRQKENILPPNCDNPSYCKGINICKPDGFCKFIKNPVNYSLRKIKVFSKNKH